jgi:hypothetical protein
VLPVICHSLAAAGAPDEASWQSGRLDDKLSFALSGQACVLLHPLMFYSMVCLGLLIAAEAKFAGRLAVRFGIFTGVPVATWYSVVVGVMLADIPDWLSSQWLGFLGWAAAALAVPVGCWAGYRFLRWAYRRLKPEAGLLVACGSILYGLIGAAAAFLSEEATSALIWPAYLAGLGCFFSLIFASVWALVTYFVMSVRLLWVYPQPPRFLMIQLLAAISWLAAFLAACRWAIVYSLEEYSKLPTTAPGDCYVASAAANGHARFTKSWEFRSADESIRVTRQLQVLKAAELTLLALVPQSHLIVRRMYDRFAPGFARRLQNPYLADLAYLSLKPLEWLSWGVLCYVLGAKRTCIDQLYSVNRDHR